jgi:hypothetical protein
MSHEGDVSTRGRWSGVGPAPGDSTTLGDNQGVYGVHAVLMRTGRVLLWSGRAETAAYLYRSWSFDPSGWSPPSAPPAVEGRWFLSRFDPGGASSSPPGPPPRWSDDRYIDLFCSHHVVLEDGRVLVVGGAGGAAEGDARGNRAVFVYDIGAERWDKGPHLLNHGRWYPTAVTLADGRVAVFSGRGTGTDPVEPAEVLGLPDLQPATVSGSNRRLYIYPGLMLVRGGRIFYVPTAWEYEGAATAADAVAGQGPTGSFQLTAPTQGTWVNYTDPANPAQPLLPANPLREEGTFVLLPPAQAGRVMIIGGGHAHPHARDSAATQDAAAQLGSCEILETQGPSPRWAPVGRMRRPRSSPHVLLLPDGKVLLLGGHDGVKRNHANDQNRAELFDPSVPFDPANPSAAFTDVGEMHASRNYHAAALLLADARVLVAGGEDNQHHGGNQKTLEVYEPPYCHQGTRPDISAVRATAGPDDHIRYGGEFVIESPQAATISRVVLIRPAAPTHHTDTEQRYVPLNFRQDDPSSNELRVSVVSDPTVAPPGWYLLFIVDSAGRPCNRATFVRLSHRHCRLVADRSTFSVLEAEAASGPIPGSLFVYVDGFLPAELGILSCTPSASQLAAWAPQLSFYEGPSQDARIVATPTHLHCEDGALPAGRRQRFTFEYSVTFADLGAFPSGTTEVREVEVRSALGAYRCAGRVRLTRQPNPYLLDGPVHWLATDVRVFKLRAGESRFGITLDATNPNPLQFIQDLMAAFDANPALLSHPYTTISEDQATSRLQLSQFEAGTRVFNFAVARVRYRALTLSATNVRVFFRLFTTAATNLDFDLGTTYRRHEAGANIAPLLGVQGTEVVTIPFFASPRVSPTTQSMRSQTDPPNVKTLPPDPSGQEVRRYFGAWLDFNQPDGEFPRYPGAHPGPYNAADLVSIPDLIRGRHQCLVAEIVFPPDPTPPGANPANEDNLAQRNLAIEGSDNPGEANGHTVALTFDIKPTWSVHRAARGAPAPDLVGEIALVHQPDDEHGHGQPRGATAAGRGDGKRHGGEHEEHGGEHGGGGVPPTVGLPPLALGDRAHAKGLLALEPVGVAYRPGEHEHRVPPEFNVLTPDELMILWDEVPREAVAELYIPWIRAEDILALARLRDLTPPIQVVDDHTVSFPVADVSHIPIPAIGEENLAALLTVALPRTVRVGEVYRVVVKQVSHLEQRVVGTFELRIPVNRRSDQLAGEQDTLAVMGYITRRLPEADRWKPVLERYLRVVSGRVGGFGGDPDAVKPSLEGHRPRPTEEGPPWAPRCPDMRDLARCLLKWCPPLRIGVDVFCRLAEAAGRCLDLSAGDRDYHHHGQADHEERPG